jgi:glutamate synthase (ferredoxin)
MAFSGPEPEGDPDTGGQYRWRHDGERHLFNPETIHRLQYACRTGDYARFKEYTRLVDEQSRELYTLRALMRTKPVGPKVPIEEVEPVESIVRRFKTGAMSYGSISQEAHEALAIAMNRVGGKSNTGEGGEDPARYTKEENGDSKNRSSSQDGPGATPGEGGQLPGKKVYPWIAKVRHSTPGVGLISPPPHHDIYSIEDLAELIHDPPVTIEAIECAIVDKGFDEGWIVPRPPAVRTGKTWWARVRPASPAPTS